MHSPALRAGIADQPRSQRYAHGEVIIRMNTLIAKSAESKIQIRPYQQ
jgi:hypothetical protein